MAFFLIVCLLTFFFKFVLADILFLICYLVLLQCLTLDLFFELQTLLYLDPNFFLFDLFLPFLFLLRLVSVKPLLLLVPSHLSPFNFTLMQGLVNAHDLDLIRKVLASDPSACSFLSLVGDEDTLVHFQLFLPLFRHINNTGIIITMSRRVGRLAVLLGLACAPLGFGVAKSREMFGDEILQQSVRNMEEEAEQENKAVNGDNSLHYQLQSLANRVDSLLFLTQVHIDRILNLQDYSKTCNEVVKKVILPILSNYEKQEIFELKEIIIDLKESKEFNNKLALVLMRIQQRNKEVKQDNRILLQRFYELQQRLFTNSFVGLTAEAEERINLLYDYFKQRNSSLQSLLTPNNENQQPQAIPKNEQGIGQKLQYL